jgi:hypothetical protein
MSDKVYQLLAHGQWFSPGTPTSSTTKTGRHDIADEGRQVKITNFRNKHKISIKILTHQVSMKFRQYYS